MLNNPFENLNDNELNIIKCIMYHDLHDSSFAARQLYFVDLYNDSDLYFRFSKESHYQKYIDSLESKGYIRKLTEEEAEHFTKSFGQKYCLTFDTIPHNKIE